MDTEPTDLAGASNEIVQKEVQERLNLDQSTQETAVPHEWYWAEGVQGTGELPEGFNSKKYKTVLDQVKAHNSLEKAFAQTGAPEKYELGVLEEHGLKVDPESQLAKDFLTYAKDNRFSQDAVDNILKFYAQDMATRMPENREELIKKVGKEKFAKVGNWAANILDHNELDTLDKAIGSSELLLILDKLRAGSAKSNAMGVEEQNQKFGVQADSKDRIQAEISRNYEKYQKDPSYRDHMMKRLARVISE